MASRKRALLAPTDDWQQLQFQLDWTEQTRYELIRPLVLFADRTPKQRAEETQTHVETVRDLTRRFQKQGILGLLPDDVILVPKGKATRVPPAVVEELARLKTFYPGFAYRELARIIFHTTMHRLTGQTARRLWDRLPPVAPPSRPLLDYHSHPERGEARQEVITLYAQGWSKRSISGFLQVSRPTVDRWIRRFEAEHFAGLADKGRAFRL
jgi:transposase